MNYLAVYNKPIKEIRKKLLEYLPNELVMDIEYSRYDFIDELFNVKIPSTSIIVREIKKSVIVFSFSTQNIQFKCRHDLEIIMKKIFIELGNGFNDNKYLDVKKKFLEITDSKSLSVFLSSINLIKPLDSGIGKKLIETFKKTDMYKNIFKDYKDFTENYAKIMKNDSHEVELFRLEILDAGKIKMTFIGDGEGETDTYNDFENLINSKIFYNDYENTIRECIRDECEFFRKNL